MTQSDRLVNAYPELRGGRFAVIADFEEPAQMELFRLETGGSGARLDRMAKGGLETGPACLRFTSTTPEDAIVISNENAVQWSLHRDWREYDLLLLSLLVPAEGQMVGLALRGGGGDPGKVIQSSVALKRGWNALRFDLAEIGERIPLDDIREIRITAGSASGPCLLQLDDMILTSSREMLMGQQPPKDGELYVRSIGRRWRVGSGGRFEITFANGQIVEWFNLASDPYRNRNLVAGTSLGPHLSYSGVQAGDDPSLLDLGAVEVRQRILEMNPVRAVIGSERSSMPATDTRPGLSVQTTFTIYRTGQVYALVRSDPGTSNQFAPDGGCLSISWFGAAFESPSLATDQGYGFVKGSHSWLLFAVDGSETWHMINASSESTEAGVFFKRARSSNQPGDSMLWNCLLYLAPGMDRTDEEMHYRAKEFTRPRAPTVEVGSLMTTSDCPSCKNGFDPSSGSYRLQPDRGQVRLFLDGKPLSGGPWFSPAFTVLDTASKETWVYVDHQLLTPTSRDGEGNLIFQISDMAHDRTIVEILVDRS